MANVSTLVGASRAPSALYNEYQQNTAGTNSAVTNVIYAPGRRVAGGSTAASTYPATSQVVITGSGYLLFAAGGHANAAAQTVKLRIKIDGTTVFDQAAASCGTYGGIVGCGAQTATGLALAKVRFNSSLEIAVTYGTNGSESFIKYVAEIE